MGLLETFSKKETKVRTPDIESQEKDQPNEPIELVNTERVKGFVAKMRDRIDKSPVAKKYQDKIHEKLNKLLGNRNSEVGKLQVDTEAALAMLTSSIENELDEFDKSTGIDDAHKLVAKKEEVKEIFNLETYRKKGSYWVGIRSKLKSSVGIDEDGVKKLQELFGLQPDGKVGPATINKFSKVFDLGVKPVKYGKETRYVDEAKSEEAKAAEVVRGLVGGVKDSVDNFQQGLEMRREWGELGVPSNDKESLIKLYGDPLKALNKVKVVSKYVKNDVEMMVALAAKLEKINSEQELALICNYFNRFKNEGVTFRETVEWIGKTPRIEEAISFHKAIEASGLAKSKSEIYSVEWFGIDSNPENLIKWVSNLGDRGFTVWDSYEFLSDKLSGGGGIDPDLFIQSELMVFDSKYEEVTSVALFELRVPEDVLNNMQYRKPLTDLYNLKIDHGLDLIKSINDSSDVGDFMKINYSYLRNLGTPEGKVENDFLHNLVSKAKLIDFSSVEEFFKDEAILICLEVYTKMGDEKNVGKALKMGRNLYLRGVEAGKVTVDQIKSVGDLSESSLGKLKEMPIYDGRNVLFVSQRQEWEGEQYGGDLRFGHKNMIDGLKTSVGAGKVDHFMAEKEPSKEALVEMKAKILDQVKNTPPPFTFYFDGHGFERALVLYDDKVNKLEPHEVISVSEFAGAVKKRVEKFASKYEDLNKDVYVIGSCKNHTFIRNVMNIVGNDSDFTKNSVFIGASEFGQSSFSDPRWRFSDNRKVMKVGDKGVTLGNIVEAEEKYMESDFSIYAPGEDDVPMQVAEADSQGGDEVGGSMVA
jgi:hypothetical protein